MARWMGKVENFSPCAEPHGVNGLRLSCEGGIVQVVAPGPSYEHLELGTTIGVNSALELRELDFWLFQEGTLVKRFHRLYTKDRRCAIVTTRDRAQHMRRLLPPERSLWSYHYRDIRVLLKRRPCPPRDWSVHEDFLPGHCTVAANALSLAVLMNPALIVMVGVDLGMPQGVYYASGVYRNPGPNNRARALSAGRSWMSKAAKRRVWCGPRIISTSPVLRLPGVENVTTENAVRIAKELQGANENRSSR